MSAKYRTVTESRVIKEKIIALIEKENKQFPLSDKEISIKLKYGSPQLIRHYRASIPIAKRSKRRLAAGFGFVPNFVQKHEPHYKRPLTKEELETVVEQFPPYDEELIADIKKVMHGDTNDAV